MIWEPFVLALVLGLIISAGLYFAYLWPSVESDPEPESNDQDRAADPPAPPAEPPPPAADTGDAASPAP